MKKLLLKLLKRLLTKHKFKPTDLIYKDGTRTLFEVDDNYYSKDLEPVTIVRAYPVGTQLFGIDRHAILEFREFNKPTSASTLTTASDVGMTAHDNTNFGKK